MTANLWQETPWIQNENTIHITGFPLPSDEFGMVTRVNKLMGSPYPVTSAANLRKAFQDLGYEVLCVKVLVNLETNEPKSTAFVTLSDPKKYQELMHRRTIRIHNQDCPVGQAVQKPGGSSDGHAGLGVPQHGNEDNNFVQDGATIRIENLPNQLRTVAQLKNSLAIAKEQTRCVSLNGSTALVTLLNEADAKRLIKQRFIMLGGFRADVSRPLQPVQVEPLQPQQMPQASAAKPVPAQHATTSNFQAGKVPPANVGESRRSALANHKNDAESGVVKWNTTRSPLHQRRFESVGAVQSPVIRPFTVMTWNTLFSDYAHNHTYCEERDLEWWYRCGLIQGCIQSLQADVIGLQETESDDEKWDCMREFLQGLGGGAGYHVFHMPKAVDGSKRSVDSIALCLRKDVFTVRSTDVVKMRLHPHFAQVGIAVRATHRITGRDVVFAVTHLKASKLEEDERVAQMSALLTAILLQLRPNGAPVVVMGDFNSEPLWDLIPSLKAGSPVGALRDVYTTNASVAFTDKHFSTFSFFEQDVADYILHTDGLTVNEVLRVPGSRSVAGLYQADYGGAARRSGPYFEMLPTKSFPSDHLPMMASFVFTEPQVETTGFQERRPAPHVQHHPQGAPDALAKCAGAAMPTQYPEQLRVPADRHEDCVAPTTRYSPPRRPQDSRDLLAPRGTLCRPATPVESREIPGASVSPPSPVPINRRVLMDEEEC